VRTALARLDAELTDVSRDRPKIDAFTNRLKTDLAALGQQLEMVRGQISAVVRQSEVAADSSIDERRLRAAGRVSYYLETGNVAQTTSDRTRLEALDAEISSLEAIADQDAKAERLSALQLQVSAHATELLRRLPFDKNYPNCHVSFDARKLAIRFVIGPRVMEMRDVGGDESYLSGHVATLLALHRVFADGNRPVPGVLVFDQLSRPFFPADQQGEIEVRGGDREELKRYFDLLFEEVAVRGNLQVIVLEHAYFADDLRYTGAVRARWTEFDRLIPSDWPRITGTPGVSGRIERGG